MIRRWRAALGTYLMYGALFAAIFFFAWQALGALHAAFAADSAAYLRSAESAGRYLIGSVREDGSFVYERDAVTGATTSDYNILRHAGTVYAMIELADRTDDAGLREELLSASERAIGYLSRQMVPCPRHPDALCVEEDDEIKLGGNGLAILALSTYEQVTGESTYRERAQRMARWVVAIQDETGDFTVHKLESGEVDAFRSEYYPGEAMYGLVRLYELDGNDEWLATAASGAAHLIALREDVPLAELPHDHWFLYTLNELHENDPQFTYVRAAARHFWTIKEWQLRDESLPSSRLGAFSMQPRSAPTATRLEAAAAARDLFARENVRFLEREAEETLEYGLPMLMHLQVTDDDVATGAAVAEARGGFIESFTDATIRIDFPQHAISALLGGVE